MDESKTIKVIATYVSGREEAHYVEKTNTTRNRKLEILCNKLNSFPNIISVRIERKGTTQYYR